MKPQRIQLSRKKGWRMPPNTLKVDRTSKWGNPFVVGVHGTQAECVHLFELLLGGALCIASIGQTWGQNSPRWSEKNALRF